VTIDRTEQDRILVEELRRAVAGLAAVYRFGSSADGSEHRSSDTDIALLAQRPLAPAVRFSLQERLASLLKRDVDLVDLAAASPVMAIQVIGHGQVILDAHPVERGLFEDRVLGAYARLNEERRGILARIREEGTVYGR
jgi:predicted nucleotidyltransferase